MFNYNLQLLYTGVEITDFLMYVTHALASEVQGMHINILLDDIGYI